MALSSKQVLRSIHIVAVLLSATLMSGAQCLELCSFLSCDQAAKATPAEEQTPPCHKKHLPSKPKAPASEPCSHQEVVAEQQSFGSAPDTFHATQMAVNDSTLPLPDFDAVPALRTETRLRPDSTRLSRPSVLRL